MLISYAVSIHSAAHSQSARLTRYRIIGKFYIIKSNIRTFNEYSRAGRGRTGIRLRPRPGYTIIFKCHIFECSLIYGLSITSIIAICIYVVYAYFPITGVAVIFTDSVFNRIVFSITGTEIGRCRTRQLRTGQQHRSRHQRCIFFRFLHKNPSFFICIPKIEISTLNAGNTF